MGFHIVEGYIRDKIIIKVKIPSISRHIERVIWSRVPWCVFLDAFMLCEIPVFWLE